MHKRIAAVAATIFSITPSIGQTDSAPNREWDRATAVAFALENNADLRAARLSIELAESRLARTGIRTNPTMILQYSSDFLFNDEGEHTLGIGFMQKFPLANRLKLAKAVSRVDIAKAKAEIRIQEIAIAQSINEVALDLQVNDTRRASLGRLLSKSEEIASFIQSRVQLGEYSQLEANQATLEARSLAQEINQLSDERTHLVHALEPLLGLTAEREMSFIEIKEISLSDDSLLYEDSIFDRHPEFQLATLEAHSAEAEIALAKSETWEDVTARLFLENERSMDEPNGLGTDRFIGVGLWIPLPLRKKGELQAREQRIARHQSHMKAAAIKLRVQHEIEHARHEMDDLRKSIHRYRKEVVELAEQQLEETQTAHKKGQISFVALMEVQRQLLEVEHSHLDTLESFAQVRQKLEIALLKSPGLSQ
jgi:cobalt-zinc-cadmium efflux system outer membrane protein